MNGEFIKAKVEQINIDRDPDRNGELRNFFLGHCREQGLGMKDWWIT